MKTPLKLIFSLAGFALLATPVLRADETAAPPAGQPDRHERRENIMQMAKDLNLTADQQAKIEAIHQQAGEARKAIWADTSLTEDQKHAKLKELRKGTMEQVHALLTPEQQAKAKELREKHGPHGDQPPTDKPPGQ
jgi:periplasmic protein CpxP/Spy